MKRLLPHISTILVLLGCTFRAAERGKGNDSSTSAQEFSLRAREKLIVRGDFDGDAVTDTITERILSLPQGHEIDSTPDPLNHNWDAIIKWFHDRKAELVLTMQGKLSDTIHLGSARGLYSLINLGDINLDGRDEIACVTDYLDFSNLNSCHIYSLCHGTWTEMKRFSIHEDAFSFARDQMRSPDRIKGHLEKSGDQWVYSQFQPDTLEDDEETPGMKPLVIEKCK